MMTSGLLLAPRARGVKVRPIVQLPPGAMGPVVHVSVSVKPLWLLTRMLMMLRSSEPVLRIVTVRTVLVMPTR
jgi:hypothetical protein